MIFFCSLLLSFGYRAFPCILISFPSFFLFLLLPLLVSISITTSATTLAQQRYYSSHYHVCVKPDKKKNMKKGQDEADESLYIIQLRWPVAYNHHTL